jgi:hypothetical protein
MASRSAARPWDHTRNKLVRRGSGERPATANVGTAAPGCLIAPIPRQPKPIPNRTTTKSPPSLMARPNPPCTSSNPPTHPPEQRHQFPRLHPKRLPQSLQRLQPRRPLPILQQGSMRYMQPRPRRNSPSTAPNNLSSGTSSARAIRTLFTTAIFRSPRSVSARYVK